MRESYRVDYNTLSTNELLDKKKSLLKLKLRADRLPDGGKKIDNHIKTIDSILEGRASQPCPNTVRFTSCRRVRLPEPEQINSFPFEEVDDSENKDVNDITLELQRVDINDSKSVEDDGFPGLPKNPLNSEEIDLYRNLCNLPSIHYAPDVLCHPIFVYLGFVSCDFIYLRAFDCTNPTNIFSKFGTPNSWNLSSQSADSLVLPKPILSHPGLAIKDLWNFVHNVVKGTRDIPVLVFSNAEGLRNFKRLFSTSSVQHYVGTKVRYRNIQFIVHPTSASKKDVESPKDLENLDSHLYSLAAKYSEEPMTVEDLSKLRPKTVTWLEAYLNYRAFLRITMIPPDDVVDEIADRLAATGIGNPSKPYQPLAASAPILNDIGDGLIKKLAVSGFTPRTMGELAARGGWRGFFGLLNALKVSINATQPLAELYTRFSKVNRHLAFNFGLFKENAKYASVKDVYDVSQRTTKTLLRPLPLQPERPEKLIRLRMPPPNDDMLRYRDNPEVDSDDDPECETDDSQA